MAKKKVEIEETDSKKVLSELKNELKQEKEKILNEVDSKINEKVEYAVSKRMKEEEKKFVRGKNAKILRRDITILILLAIVGYFGYCLYKVDYFDIRKDVEKLTNKEDKKEEVKPVEVEKDSKYYVDNYSFLVDKLMINDNSLKELLTGEVTNDLMLKIAYKNLNKKDIIENDNMFVISDKALLESAKYIFGKNTTLEYKTFSYNNIKYLYFNESFIGEKNEYKNIDLLYKVYFGKEKYNTLSLNILVYKIKDNNLLNMNDELVVENINENDITKHKNKLDKYKITFEKEEETYIFSKIEAI